VTIERKCVIALNDIKAVSFECTSSSCGARLSISPENINRTGIGRAIPFRCPSCNEEWRDKSPAQIEKGMMMTAPEEFIAALLKLTDKNCRVYGFRIFLEIEQPE